MALLIESCDILHSSELEEKETNTEHITFVYVMFCESRISIYNMRFPQNWWQILWSAPDSSSLCTTTVFSFSLENVFWFTEIDNFYFSIGKQKQVGRF